MFKPIGHMVFARIAAAAGIACAAMVSAPTAPVTDAAPATAATVAGPVAPDLAEGEAAWDCTDSDCVYVGGWN